MSAERARPAANKAQHAACHEVSFPQNAELILAQRLRASTSGCGEVVQSGKNNNNKNHWVEMYLSAILAKLYSVIQTLKFIVYRQKLKRKSGWNLTTGATSACVVLKLALAAAKLRSGSASVFWDADFHF